MSNFVPVAMIIFEGAGDDLKTIAGQHISHSVFLG